MAVQVRTTWCPGTGKRGIGGAGDRSIYAHCPDCGREFSAQGRQGQARLGDPWKSIPRHFAGAA